MGTPFPFLSSFSFYFSERHTHTHTLHSHTRNAVHWRVSELGGDGAGRVAAPSVSGPRRQGRCCAWGLSVTQGTETYALAFLLPPPGLPTLRSSRL